MRAIVDPPVNPSMASPADSLELTRHWPLAAGHWLWLVAALAFSLLFTVRSMQLLLVSGEVIQDDARQHVFWMLRFQDPEAFRDDLIADYFQAQAPAGYAALYWILSWVMDPRVASKVLPFVLGAVLAVFTFLFTRKLHPSPLAAFLATVLVTWYAWQQDDLSSGSPRAFLLPMLVAFLWAVVSGRRILAVLLTVLGALLYQVGAALALSLLALRLVHFRGRRPLLSRDRAAWLQLVAATALVAIVMVPGELLGSEFGPPVSVAEARAMPEFADGGRVTFFVEDAYRYWLASFRSGFNLRITDQLIVDLPVLYEYAALAAFLLPLIMLRRHIGAARLPRPEAVVLAQVLLVSLTLFFLAHLLLFRLYLPARYVQWTVPLVFGVVGGLALGIVVEQLTARAPAFRGVLALALAAGLALYPAKYDAVIVGNRHPKVAAYLRTQPKDVLVAAAAVEADSIPTFAGRRVLTSREYALPYHLGYYNQMRQRTEDLIDAYYAESPRAVLDLIDRYGVDLIVVNRAAFNPTTLERAWTHEFEPYSSMILEKLGRSQRFILLDLARRCAVVDSGEVAVVPATCVEALR
jgi:hypothetical protein